MPALIVPLETDRFPAIVYVALLIVVLPVAAIVKFPYVGVLVTVWPDPVYSTVLVEAKLVASNDVGEVPPIFMVAPALIVNVPPSVALSVAVKEDKSNVPLVTTRSERLEMFTPSVAVAEVLAIVSKSNGVSEPPMVALDDPLNVMTTPSFTRVPLFVRFPEMKIFDTAVTLSALAIARW